MKLNKDEVRAGLANIKSTSQPSTGLRPPSPAPASEGNVRKLEWWESLTPGERKLICCVMRMLRGAKRSHLRDVAGAATKWERGIGCFIKVRLMGACRTGQLSKTGDPARRQLCLRCCPPHPACDRWACVRKAETLKPES